MQIYDLVINRNFEYFMFFWILMSCGQMMAERPSFARTSLPYKVCVFPRDNYPNAVTMSEKPFDKLMICFCPVLAYAVLGRQIVMHESWNDGQTMALLSVENEQVLQLLVWLLFLQVINGLDAGITAIFGVEALLKITAFSFTAYIRLNSNKVQHCWHSLVQPSLLHIS